MLKSTFCARTSVIRHSLLKIPYVRISRFSSKKLPGAPERMRFGIEDDFAEIQSLGRSEEEIKIFECLGQNEALHFIALTLGHDISKRGVAAIGAAIFHKIIEHFLAHLPVLPVTRVA